MKNETIKKYTEVTVEEAAQLQRDGWQRFSLGDGAWTDRNLDGIAHDGCERPFYCDASNSWYARCAKVTELDPCKAPDGCPELEPWMAYVGDGEQLKDWKDFKFLLNYGCHWGTCSHSAPAFPDSALQWAIDVRTAWAQEHFPELCRIRNYQEPDPLEEWLAKQKTPSSVSIGFYNLQLREAYELGQANPTK